MSEIQLDMEAIKRKDLIFQNLKVFIMQKTHITICLVKIRNI